MKETRTATRQLGATTAEIVTYTIIGLMIIAVPFGMYHNNRIDNAMAAALAIGEAEKDEIEEYFQANGVMPQSEIDAGLAGFVAEGIIEDLLWQPGIAGDPYADTELNGTITAMIDMSAFGLRFEELESGFLLIAKGQEDGTVLWDCTADPVRGELALSRRYLPEGCVRESEAEDGEE